MNEIQELQIDSFKDGLQQNIRSNPAVVSARTTQIYDVSSRDPGGIRRPGRLGSPACLPAREAACHRRMAATVVAPALLTEL